MTRAKNTRAPRRRDDTLDPLYAAPLGEFVAARTALAKRLAAAGRTAEATRVRDLAKPNAIIWALNKVARSDTKAVRAFVEAFDALKRAQLRLPAAVPEATHALRGATETLVHKATDAIAKAGLRVTVETHRRLGTTLRGAAADARDELLQGALAEELSASGFDVFEGETPTRARGKRVRDRVARVTTQPVPRLPSRSREADDSLRRRDSLRRHAEQLEEHAAETRRLAERAASEALDARQRLRQLELRASAAQRAAEKSARAAAVARKRVRQSPAD